MRVNLSMFACLCMCVLVIVNESGLCFLLERYA